MAVFQNQASVSYGTTVRLSNVATGTIAEAVTVNKTAIEDSYDPGTTLTYVVNIMNGGTSPLTEITLTDDLGAIVYAEEKLTVIPLDYVDGSAAAFVNGVPAPSPTAAVTAAGALEITGLSVPVSGTLTLVYQTTVNEYAPLGTGAQIVNTVTVTGDVVLADTTATAAVPADTGVDLTVHKSVSPETVRSGDTLTYTFVLSNTGAVEASGDVVLTDVFDPVLTNLTASLDGAALVLGTDYAYDEASGTFETTPGAITVPAAVYTEDPTTGAWSTEPGTATLVITGTI
jgi:uncharacterized repeat protein (TIGR01451 family)